MLDANGLKTFILGLSTHNNEQLFEQSAIQHKIRVADVTLFLKTLAKGTPISRQIERGRSTAVMYQQDTEKYFKGNQYKTL